MDTDPGPTRDILGVLIVGTPLYRVLRFIMKRSILMTQSHFTMTHITVVAELLVQVGRIICTVLQDPDPTTQCEIPVIRKKDRRFGG